MDDELRDALVVDLPLRGEGWVAVNSRADRIPSHGTDMLGQRYAFDFFRADPRRRSLRYHAASTPRTVLLGVPTRECLAWGQPVHAPLPGEVVAAVDRFPERRCRGRSWWRRARQSRRAMSSGAWATPATPRRPTSTSS
jgi:hypothetical protein